MEATDIRDEADRRRLDELERRLTWSVVLAMLGAVPESIIAMDPDGVIVYVNEQGEALFGWPKVELLGQDVRMVLPDGLEYRSREDHAGDDTPVPVVRQTSALRRDGTSFPAAISISEADAGADQWVLAAIRDVTTALEFEQELVGARHDALAADAAKDEFLSRMSHELRTPLNAVLGFGQLLGMDELTANQIECVTQIIGAGAHLLGLVDEVLDISQLAQGAMRLSLEPVALNEVVTDVVGMIRPLAERRHVDVRHTVNADLFVVADRQRIKQVITNLLANAIKYNCDGGSVHIASLTIDDERCRVTVTDTGLGIAGDELDLLFRPFERLSSASADVEGTGLGLALAKRLVEAMGGTVGVTSEVGVGSSFWIELPYLPGMSDTGDRPPVAVPEATVVRKPAAKIVLYIEDNPSNIRLLERVLDHRPEVRLIIARDGLVGLDLAFEHRPALVLLDLGLPGMSGEEVLTALKADPRSTGIPVVVISADATPQRPAELHELGAAALITKPFDVTRILHLVDNLGREGAAIDGTAPEDPDDDVVSAPAANTDRTIVEPLDPARVLELRSLCGTDARWRAYVDEFCVDTRIRIGTLLEAATAGDALAVMDTAHALSGSCSITGAQLIVVILEDIQHNARSGQIPGDSQLATLEQEYATVEALLSTTPS